MSALNERPKAFHRDVVYWLLRFGDKHPEQVWGDLWDDIPDDARETSREDADMIARSPITEWERDRAVELLRRAVENVHLGPGEWWPMLNDFLDELEIDKKENENQ